MKRKIERAKQKAQGKMKKVVAIATTVAAAGQAFAAGDILTAPSFALDNVVVVAGALLVGLAGFWAIRKGLSVAK